MLTVRRSFRAGDMMISKQWICGAALALLAGGCNTVTGTVPAGKSTVVGTYGMYSQSDCTTWELPEVSVTTQPTHGSITTSMAPSAFDKGHPCYGKSINQRVITYTPKAGFRGQDRFSVKYDFITNDGGGRGARGRDYVVEVK